MKLTDFVAEFLVNQKIHEVFGLTGGAVVHFFDSLNKTADINPIFTHHEQSAALAAQAYARINKNLGAAIVTTGPGCTNAITGTLAAWQDSVPCLFISGQARFEHTTQGKPVRQIGTQQLDIVPIVSSITKYAITLENPKMIKYHLQKAVYLAKNGRPGPVWIDVPLNFQWADINPDKLTEFQPPKEQHLKIKDQKINKIYAEISKAKRPLFLLGHGIRLAHAEKEIHSLINKLQIPFVTSWGSADLIPTDHRLNVGRIGITGTRGGNLAVQNCDLIIAVGSHLSLQLTGANYKNFARKAKKIVVNIDKNQLDNLTIPIEFSIHCDAKVLIQKLLKKTKHIQSIDFWLNKCLQYKKYNLYQTSSDKYVDSYGFLTTLSNLSSENDVIVVDGGGTALYNSHQAFRLKKEQRLICSTGISAMGTGLPESIGACFANKKKQVLCLIGDGSMQLNIQELQTIFHHQLPIKIFVFNNSGYLAIRHTQNGFLEKNYVGSSFQGGLSLPNFLKIAKAYKIKCFQIKNHLNIEDKIKKILQMKAPVICDLLLSKKQPLIPSLGFTKTAKGTFISKPFEDMSPYLSREEFKENMIIESI